MFWVAACPNAFHFYWTGCFSTFGFLFLLLPGLRPIAQGLRSRDRGHGDGQAVYMEASAPVSLGRPGGTQWGAGQPCHSSGAYGDWRSGPGIPFSRGQGQTFTGHCRHDSLQQCQGWELPPRSCCWGHASKSPDVCGQTVPRLCLLCKFWIVCGFPTWWFLFKFFMFGDSWKDNTVFNNPASRLCESFMEKACRISLVTKKDGFDTGFDGMLRATAASHKVWSYNMLQNKPHHMFTSFFPILEGLTHTHILCRMMCIQNQQLFNYYADITKWIYNIYKCVFDISCVIRQMSARICLSLKVDAKDVDCILFFDCTKLGVLSQGEINMLGDIAEKVLFRNIQRH